MLTNEEINSVRWNLNLDEAPELKNLFVTIEGYDEVCLAAKLKGEWFLINNFEQKFKGDNGAVKVIAWKYQPIYKP